MREMEFRRFLSQEGSIDSDKAVTSRVSKALAVEKEFKVNLDNIVDDDQITYQLLIKIKNSSKEHNGVRQNAVRKYYKFANGREFPRLDVFISR